MKRLTRPTAYSFTRYLAAKKSVDDRSLNRHVWEHLAAFMLAPKGNRWVERILSLRQTCRLRSLKIYPILVDTVQRYFRGQETNMAWITQH